MKKRKGDRKYVCQKDFSGCHSATGNFLRVSWKPEDVHSDSDLDVGAKRVCDDSIQGTWAIWLFENLVTDVLCRQEIQMNSNHTKYFTKHLLLEIPLLLHKSNTVLLQCMTPHTPTPTQPFHFSLLKSCMYPSHNSMGWAKVKTYHVLHFENLKYLIVAGRKEETLNKW